MSEYGRAGTHVDAHVGTQIETLLVRTVGLGGSALSQAAQRGAVAAWYARCPDSPGAWSTHAKAVRAAFPSADWLTALAPALAATGAAAERLARSAAAGVVITTGQQPGLFGGPTYTWSKAMSALAVANMMEQATGIPVAPVFWAASDDADWMEAAVTHVASARGLVTAQLAGPPTEGVAMADVPLGPLADARALLASACGSSPQSGVLEVLDAAYVPHATIGAAYVQLLRALLEPLGIAVLDAAHPAVREAADAFLRGALRQASAVHESLTARSAAIVEAGFAPQVEVVDGLSLVFRTQRREQDGAVRRVRERVPIADAAAVAREADVGSLGSNVLLRPVLERAMMPTVCYLAGPGEYAYFAQIGPVAAALGAAAPVAAPRWACELIDERMLARQAALGIPEAALRDPYAAEQLVARAHLDEAVADTLERLRLTLEAQLGALMQTVAGDDAPVVDTVVQGLSRDIGHRLERFERRVLAGVKRREGEAMREVAALRAALRPSTKSPERVLNIIPFLVRYGTGVLDAMVQEARPHARRLVLGASDATVETAVAS